MYLSLMLLCLGLVSGQQLPADWDLCIITGVCECNYDENEVICEDVTINDIFLWQHFPANLQRVVLRNNGINNFPPNFFSAKGLVNLAELYIDDNPLTDLQAGEFLTAQFLQFLEIENSKLSDLPENLLMHLLKLKNLRLEKNSLLKSLPDCLLYGLEELTHFYVGHSHMITEIPRRLFWGTPHIQHVDLLNNTGLTSDSFSYDMFHSSNTLTYFRIRDTLGVTIVKNTWFKNLNSTEDVELRFHGCGIQAVERRAFDGVPNINFINFFLNDLSLEGIPDDLFNHIADVDDPVQVDFRNNPRLTTLPPACNVDGIMCTDI